MGIAINEDIIEEIKARSNIVDVIGRYVNLKRAGNNYKGLCPFHNEKTPSFVASEEKQIFSCFGCGAHGDVIEFVKKIENLDFVETIQRLADDCGVELVENSNQKDEAYKNELYEVNRLAARHFYSNFTEDNNPGKQYMLSRKIDQNTLKKFGIGYAKNEWHDLIEFFKSNDIDLKKYDELGMTGKKDGKIYDKYRHRVIFPIINTRGKVIGFGGRAIDDDQMPKYLNSSESVVFLKKYNLYGINLTGTEIRKKKYAILVEGYMDVIGLYQHGVKNVVASLGTALTSHQAKMIKRYAENVVIAYDSDEAGQTATLRAIDLLEEVGCKIKILKIDHRAKDPDEYINKYGHDEFLKEIKLSVSYFDYKIDILRSKNDINTKEGRIEFVKQVTAELGKLKSPIEIDLYKNKIAEESGIGIGAIEKEMGTNKDKNNQWKKESKPETDENREKNWKNNPLEQMLIMIMLTQNSLITKVEPLKDIIWNPINQKIFAMTIETFHEKGSVEIDEIRDSLEEDEIQEFNKMIKDVQLGGKDEQVLSDIIEQINYDRLIKRQNEIIDLLDTLDEEYDVDAINSLSKELLEIQNLKKGNKFQGRRV